MVTFCKTVILRPFSAKTFNKNSISWARGHSKSTFARNFQFLTPVPPLFVPVRFTCTPPPPTPQRTFALASYPPLKKSSATLMTVISNKKLAGEKREKN